MTGTPSTDAAAGLDAATAELLTESLRELFAAHPDGSGLAGALAELGWSDVQDQDPAGAVTLLFTEHGRALAASSLLDDVVLAALPDGPAQVLYSCGDCGTLLRPYDPAAEVLVLGEDGTARVLPPGALAPRPLDAFDTAPGRFTAVAGPEGTALASDAGERAVAAAHRALAAELIGVCQSALDLAVQHTSARFQYGRPLATFQAVRHRLSESHVALEAARATLGVAWDDGGAWAARVAKIRAGQAQEQVTRAALQVFGAMGLTLESPLHRHVTRAAFLDLLLGGHRALAERTGAEILAGADPAPLVAIG
ncbi:acyl-CoA dehydrogenase family protein [Peterkaempfera bronchialis]|uniref:Acyl-CoA dehydrogenase n=1 Tax=Peterkaempfera bronchialis TaxID=2126346 RepID=A0A345SR10_9ACTN|nr:acyl-CoA dehydrogenase family protein [Peterkaempfera bronchialis]AXI76165.1 acyl-CoA dehydrogenase [Peterkaempfera bronchialis]